MSEEIQRWAVVEGGIGGTVTNHAEASAEVAAERAGWVLAGTSRIGDIWEGGGVFAAPPPAPPVVPQAITMRQARLALLGAGKLAGVDAAIAAIPDQATKQAAQIEWEFSNELQRHNPFVLMLAPALGLTSAQVDALFIAGQAL